jgi:hypothetical protein
MALQNYRERKIGCHVILKTTEADMAAILLTVNNIKEVEFRIGERILHPEGVSITRLDEKTYRLQGYDKWEDVNQLKIPSDLLKVVEYILENNLYDSISIRHEEEGIKEEIYRE